MTTDLTRYMRKERTVEPSAPKGAFHVSMYRDKEATDRIVTWSWWSSMKPRKGAKRVTLNGYRWPVVWLEGLT